MRKVENDCCGCASPAYPCLGNSCPRRSVVHFYCDRCNEETELYHYEGEELCIECIEKSLEKVEE